MSIDFRDYLEEASRNDKFGRYFKEIAIGVKIVASIQASSIHACEPTETLDDVTEYTAFDVNLRQTNKPIGAPFVGVWLNVNDRPWAEGFEQPEFSKDVHRDNMPVEDVKVMFEELVAYAREHNQMDEDEMPVLLNPDEPIKKIGGGCGGCGSKK